MDCDRSHLPMYEGKAAAHGRLTISNFCRKNKPVGSKKRHSKQRQTRWVATGHPSGFTAYQWVAKPLKTTY